MGSPEDQRQLIGDATQDEYFGTYGAISEPESAPTATRKGVRRQLFTAFGYCLGAFAMGNMIGWPSTATADLEKPDSDIHISDAEKAWIGSLACLGALFQGPLTGYLMVRLGRRLATIVMCAPLFLGWLVITLASNVWMLYLGRIVTGFSAAAFSVIAPLFISEIADPVIRGSLGTLFQMFVVFGILCMYATGYVLIWKWLAVVAAAVPLATATILLFLHDSPTSYLVRSKPDKAEEALKWFRGTEDVQDELRTIVIAVDESRRSTVGFKDVLCSRDPTVYKPLLLCVLLMVIQQMCGINAVLTYTVTIFEVSGTGIDPNISTIIVGSVQLFTTFLGSLLVNRIGRRPLLVVTEFIMTAALIGIGAYFFIKTNYPTTAETVSWLPLTCLVIFITSFSFGIGPLAWLILGELLSPKIAGVAGAIASVVNWTLAFVVTVSFPYMTQPTALYDYGTYWFFAAFCVIGNFLVILFLPETRNKTLREIQEAFAR